MQTLKFPIFSVNPIDIFYNKFISNPSLFWKLHSKNRKEGFFTEDFMNLIQLMLHPNPESRGTLAQIKNHSWTLGSVISTQELQNEIDNKRQNEFRLARNQADLRTRVIKKSKGYKGESSSSSLSLSFDDLKVKPFLGVQSNKYSKIITGLEPNALLGKLYEYIIGISTEYDISQEFYQLKAKVVTYQDPLELKITVFQKSEFYILDIDMLKGNNTDLGEIIKDLKQLIFIDR